MVVVVDLKEIIECVRKEKEILAERVANIEHERDDLLVVVVDLKETLGELNMKSRPKNSQKGKEVASDALTAVTPGTLKKTVRPGFSHSIKTKISLKNCLSVVDDDVELWHRRLGHTSFTLLNKLVRKDLVCGLPNSSFKDHKVCDACVKGKQVRGGNKYIFMTVDDYSRFTWTLFLRTKDETFEVSVAFVKNIQMKIGNKAACIRKPKQTHLRTFGCKCFVLNNGKEALEKFDAKSDEGIFLGYPSQSKADKVYNERTQCVEEDKHVDQDGEPLSVPGEVIDMANGKADMMSNVKESSENDFSTPPSIRKEPGPMITPTEAENRVVDAVQGTPLAEVRSAQEPQLDIPESSANEIQVPNWKHKSSHPLDNIITPLDSRVQTRSKARNSLTFSAFLSQNEPKNIKEPLKYADWITAIQEELHQFERNKQSQKETLISQQKYINELLKRFDMEASKVIDTPIATATHLDMDEPDSPINQAMYKGIIGSLLYLTTSRPDIVFNVGLCARISSEQEKHVWNGTFPGFLPNLMGYKEAHSVALSIVKAEYVAASSCCAQLLWIKQQLEDFGVFSDCVPLLCDNTNALNMAKNSIQHKRTKHIDVRHYFLKNNVEKGLICMKFYSTEDQIADIFTKALSREHFEKNRLALGLIKPN
ncbi:uncharacterized protein LOC142176674 [Nicotiana tabacum]|uniref:Uncharacterized protein LOC142176674 n=1 Tax=Nicotiana tabacum TaxID=4097 RepID=A0AC58TUK0_TOBAC